jgi:integrase
VKLAVRRALMKQARRPDQAAGLIHDDLTAILASGPNTLAGLRDAAIISIGDDTLCRSCELVSIEIRDLDLQEDSGSVLIRRAKSDQAGDGRMAWLSQRSGERARAWLDAGEIGEGALFRSLHLRGPSERPLVNSSVRRIVKRAAERAGLSEEAVRLSGHSMRVGGAQDMLVAGFDALAIMQAGGWKTPHVVLRYVERANMQALHQDR